MRQQQQGAWPGLVIIQQALFLPLPSCLKFLRLPLIVIPTSLFTLTDTHFQPAFVL